MRIAPALLIALTFAACPGSPAGAASPESGAPPAGNQVSAPAEKNLSIEDIISAAKKNGYEPSVVTQPDGKIASLKLTKLGKTTAGHGLLQKKWDETDTIDLSLDQNDGKITIKGVTRDVMVKPPIGDWIKQPSNQIPTWVMAPDKVNG